MQRKQQVGECWVCVIFFACVCVGASDSKTTSKCVIFFASVCVGVSYFLVDFSILADFAIFSSFLN
jgi:hypothetical protein